MLAALGDEVVREMSACRAQAVVRMVAVWVAALFALTLVGSASARQPRMTADEVRAALASDPRHPDVVTAFVGEASRGNRQRMAAYLDQGIDIDAPCSQRKHNRTALMAAIAGGHAEAARFLVNRGADLEAPNEAGETPLLLAIRMTRQRPEYNQLSADILWKGADPNASDSEGMTPLLRAMEARNHRVVRVLLEEGAHPDGRALHFATGRNLESVQLLLEHGADPDARLGEGRTPLMNAVKRGWSDVVYSAPSDGYPELYALLIDAGADVNAQDTNGTTALAEAAANGDADAIRMLVGRGADLELRDVEGRSAFDVALTNLKGDAVKTLVELGYPLGTVREVKLALARFAVLLARIFTPLSILAFALLWLHPAVRREGPGKSASKSIDQADRLPRLAPLQCRSCGAGLPLSSAQIHCPRCRTPAEPPQDYVETLAARRRAATDLQRAVSKWRITTLYTTAAVRGFFWAIGFVWLGVTAFGAFNEIGRSLFAGNLWLSLSAIVAATGMPVSSGLFANYLREVRERLPILPELSKDLGQAEIASCTTCGASIAYEAGQFATSCCYCGSEIFRVELARRARKKASEEQQQAALSLKQAMREVAERREALIVNLAMAPLVLPIAACAIGVPALYVIVPLLQYLGN